MVKLLVVVFSICTFKETIKAQNNYIRPQALGVSFFLNDFLTAQRIRNTSLSNVIANNNWAKFSDFGSGLALNYFRGIKKHIDLSSTLSGSFVPNTYTESDRAGNNFLLEGDAEANLKLFSDKYWVSPYFIAGIGASLLNKSLGAFILLGCGVKVNLFDEAAIFVNTQYRVPLSLQSNNYHFIYCLGIAGILGNSKKVIPSGVGSL